MSFHKISISLFLFSFSISVFTYSQQVKVTQTPGINIKSLEKIATEYELLEIDLTDLKKLKSKNGAVSLILDLNSETSWNLALENAQVFKSNASLRLLANNSVIQIPEPEIKTYHGYLADDPKSIAAVTIADNYLSVYVSDTNGSYILEPLNRYDNNARSSQYIYYNTQDIHEAISYECKKSELLSEINEKSIVKNNKNIACFDVEIALAVDYQMYVSEGSNVGNVLNALASIYNLVSLDYDNEFNHQLNIRVKEVVIATCNACDPWSKTNNVGHALDAIRDWGEDGGFNETYDIGIYWTTKVYDDNFAGLAYQDQICGDQRYIAVRKYTANNQALRIMMSHEIGHSFGVGHNYEIGSSCGNNPGRGPKIMDPIVDPSSSGWTNGSQSCDLNSLAVMNAEIDSATCLSPCASLSCSSISNLNLTNISRNGLTANWTGTTSNYLVRLKEEGTSNYIYTATTSSSAVTINASLEYCKQYHLSVKALCGGADNPAAITAIVEISGGIEMDVFYVEPKNCDNGSYDLEVVVSYQNTATGSFRVVANGSTQIFTYTTSPQTVTLIGLSSSNNTNALLEVYGTTNSDIACRGITTYTEPNSSCEIVICENFNNCELPYEWTSSSSNNMVFSENFEWKFDDGDRTLLNYGELDNATTSKTINGTCAAYFDDDIFRNGTYTGNISLESRTYDLTNMSEPTIEFDYNFHKFVEGKSNNSSEFSVDLFNGVVWTNVMYDDNDNCPWFNVWVNACTTNFVMDVTNFSSSQFKVRLNYTDGNNGNWTGMIMVDNFKVKGVQLPVLDLKILDFHGRLQEDIVKLDWEIELDDSFSHYLIERSADGRDFRKLDKLKNGIQYVDNQPFRGSNYYQLKIFDNDGNHIASDIILIENEMQENLILYPNPTNTDQVTLVNTTNVNYDRLKIYSIDGRQIDSMTLGTETQTVLDLSDYKEGVYLIQLSSETAAKTIRLVRI